MNFSLPDEKEIRTAFREGEAAVVALFGGVTAQVEELAAQSEKQAGALKDFRVPFDNSAAERDVRMMKVEQKVSGCFQTVEGAERFACIRGYISAVRKNFRNIFEAIKDAFLGNPFIPTAAS